LGFFIHSSKDVGICQRVFGNCQIALPKCKIIHLLQQQYDTIVPNQNKDVEARRPTCPIYLLDHGRNLKHYDLKQSMSQNFKTWKLVSKSFALLLLH
jgi:hypothetical protein